MNYFDHLSFWVSGFLFLENTGATFQQTPITTYRKEVLDEYSKLKETKSATAKLIESQGGVPVSIRIKTSGSTPQKKEKVYGN